MRALILSFMGRKPLVVAKRLNAHARQLAWLLDADPRIEIHVTAQCYADGWYHPSPRIHYVRSEEQLTDRRAAKNRMLADFYASDDDWAILADNDAALYDHQMGPTIFTHMLDHPERWQGVDYWVPLNPLAEPFNYLYRDEPEKYAANVVMVRASPMVKGSLVVIRNTRKTTGKAILFRDDREGLPADDMEFALAQLAAGHAAYKCTSAVLRELSGTTTTLDFADTPEKRRRAHEGARRMLADDYADLGLRAVPSSKPGMTRFDTRDFYKQVWRHPSPLLIPR